MTIKKGRSRMYELDSLLRAAGRMMLDYQSPKVFSKGHHADFVTEADIAVQSYLVEARKRRIRTRNSSPKRRIGTSSPTR